MSDVLSLIDLQGKLNCTYVVGFYYNPKPQRANLSERWPSSPEENIDRLADAGLPYDRQVPKCINCGRKLDPTSRKVIVSLIACRDGSYFAKLQGRA